MKWIRYLGFDRMWLQILVNGALVLLTNLNAYLCEIVLSWTLIKKLTRKFEFEVELQLNSISFTPSVLLSDTNTKKKN